MKEVGTRSLGSGGPSIIEAEGVMDRREVSASAYTSRKLNLCIAFPRLGPFVLSETKL